MVWVLQLWPKTVLRKWLNIRSTESDFSADESGTTSDETDSEAEYEGEPAARPPFPSLLPPVLHMSFPGRLVGPLN